MADSTRPLPPWAEELRATYLRGEASVFLLHGNVFDLISDEGELIPLVDYLTQVLLRKKDVVLHFNAATGVKLLRREEKIPHLDELVAAKEPAEGLAAIEKTLRTVDGVAAVLDYAEMILPAGDLTLLGETDRSAIVTVHRWSLDRRFENSDNVVVLVTENPSELAPKIVSNPRIQAIEVPLPDDDERRAIIRLLEPEGSTRDVERLAKLSAGLKNVQIRGILAPGEDSEEDFAARYELIREVLGEGPDVPKRASKLTRLTSGMNREQVLGYLRAEGHEVDGRFEESSRYDEVLDLLAKRKREVLEKETFGLVEFVTPDHDFSAVGGMDQVKRELMQIAHDIREGRTNRVPMGLLFTGPMGTGKTFVAEAFAKSSGLTTIKLKNFRSKWVGATESNLEKILGMVKAIGNVLVIIDEGDRAFGAGGSESDGGTSSRVIARIKEFMSDTTNRGRVLFVLMTNRPDKLDIDIKRAGRLDRKIPFFYSQEAEDVEPILLAQLRRHQVRHELDFPRDRETTSARLVGFSNADVEAVVLEAGRIAEGVGEAVSPDHLGKALDDYLPAQDRDMLEYMELLAVFESSSRSLLPKRYHDMEPAELQARLRELRILVAR
ncbi:MAG: AAA family ATPase [Myxococcota bacterium]